MKKEKVVDPNEPVKKRGRKRKVVHDNRSPEEILIDEIVRKCNEPNVDSEIPESPEPEKKRGRPRKIKKITSIVADDDIIEHLIAESEISGTEELEEEDSAMIIIIRLLVYSPQQSILRRLTNHTLRPIAYRINIRIELVSLV